MSTEKHRKAEPGSGELSRVDIPAAVVECAERPGMWKIETTESGIEDVVATFAGPHAKDRAVEYAFAKFAAVLCEQKVP